MDKVIDDVLEAIARADTERLRLLLHPYLHWTDPAGSTTRGRIKVLARLAEAPPAGPPRAYELRDGQVYRWSEVG
jgi:hypothetical protein